MNEIVTQPLMLKKKSKSSRFVCWTGEGNFFYDKLLRVLYLTLLFVINLVMFIYSVNGRVYENGVINEALLYIVSGVGLFFLVLILFFSFSKRVQNIICALFTMIFVAIFYYQFAEFNPDTFVEQWLEKKASWLTFIGIVPSCWLVGLLGGIIIYFIFKYSMVILFVVAVLFFATFLGIKNKEVIKNSETGYTVVKDLEKNVGNRRDTNLVYFMLPKFPSYHFLSTVRDVNFRDLRNAVIGFFATNEFEIYPNAFVLNPETAENVIDIYNQVDYTSSTSKNRGYSEYFNDWNFIHGGYDFVGLEDNRLYDYLAEKGYGISTYVMPGFNLCMKGGNVKTDRCVVKEDRSVSWYDRKASLEQNIHTILTELLLNMKRRSLVSTAKILANNSSIKGYKVNAENRRVSIEGAPKIFEVLAKHVKKDRDGQVYMVYVDLPSDIYVYDEYCNIKPRSEWIALKDNSLYSGGIDEKRKAYVEQTKCLIGKMQEFLDEMKESGKLNKTDVIVQGVSSIRELGGMVAGQYGNFVKDKLVGLGIRKAKRTKFLINANVCLASDFTKTLIRFQDYCYTVDNMKLGQADTFNLKKNLINNSVIRGGKITSIAVNYRDWYEDFKKNNVDYQNKMAEKKKIIDEKNRKERELLKLEENLTGEDEDNAPQASSMLEENIFVPSDDLSGDVILGFENEEILSAVEGEILIEEEKEVKEPKEIKDLKAGNANKKTSSVDKIWDGLSKKALDTVGLISDKAKKVEGAMVEKANELISGKKKSKKKKSEVLSEEKEETKKSTLEEKKVESKVNESVKEKAIIDAKLEANSLVEDEKKEETKVDVKAETLTEEKAKVETEAEEKGELNVEALEDLIEVGGKNIEVIKEVEANTDEALKEVVDTTKEVVEEMVEKGDEETKEKLSELSSTIENKVDEVSQKVDEKKDEVEKELSATTNKVVQSVENLENKKEEKIEKNKIEDEFEILDY